MTDSVTLMIKVYRVNASNTPWGRVISKACHIGVVRDGGGGVYPLASYVPDFVSGYVWSLIAEIPLYMNLDNANHLITYTQYHIWVSIVFIIPPPLTVKRIGLQIRKPKYNYSVFPGNRAHLTNFTMARLHRIEDTCFHSNYIFT